MKVQSDYGLKRGRYNKLDTRWRVRIMIIVLDRFLISELQERGFDIDHKKLTEIYRASRKRPDCLAHKRHTAQENAKINVMMNVMDGMTSEEQERWWTDHIRDLSSKK
jgi:hypothetical protein